MQHFSKALCMFLLPLLSLAAAAQGVAFRDGEEYQLRCLDWPAGCVVPVPDAEVGGLTSFVYRLDAQQHKSDGYWRVKRVRKGGAVHFQEKYYHTTVRALDGSEVEVER